MNFGESKGLNLYRVEIAWKGGPDSNYTRLLIQAASTSSAFIETLKACETPGEPEAFEKNVKAISLTKLEPENGNCVLFKA